MSVRMQEMSIEFSPRPEVKRREHLLQHRSRTICPRTRSQYKGRQTCSDSREVVKKLATVRARRKGGGRPRVRGQVLTRDNTPPTSDPSTWRWYPSQVGYRSYLHRSIGRLERKRQRGDPIIVVSILSFFSTNLHPPIERSCPHWLGK